jgi:transketolase N-terminal domain/subunit
MTIKKLLNYSIKNNLRHIPSALSQYSYLKILLPMLDYNDMNIVIGKPFGSQAYYTVWEDMGILDLCTNLSYGIKHDEIDFVDFSEETLGNALGVASGIAFNNKKTFVNISDGALQMGPTLEAIQYIGKHKQNILCAVDFNSMQLTGNTDDILGINIFNVASMFKIHGWETIIADTKCLNDYGLKTLIKGAMLLDEPTALIFKTLKGQGVKEMEDDPVKWHYKELKDIDEITISENS